MSILRLKLNLNFAYFAYFEKCMKTCIEASRGAAARAVTVKPTGCGFNPHSRRWNVYLDLYFHFFALVSRLSAALSSATQHGVPSHKVPSAYPAVCGIQREADFSYIGISTIVGHMVSRTFFIDTDAFYNTLDHCSFINFICVFAAHAMIEFLRSISSLLALHYCIFIMDPYFFKL